MARVPIEDRPAIAQWLIRAREMHGLTGKGLLDALLDSGAPAPNYATYAQWESGKVTPRESSLQPIIAFWAARGVPGPQELAAAEPVTPSLEERAVLAAERQADAIAALVAELREWRQADRDRIGGLEQTVEGLLVAVAPLEREDGARREPFAPRR